MLNNYEISDYKSNVKHIKHRWLVSPYILLQLALLSAGFCIFLLHGADFHKSTGAVLSKTARITHTRVQANTVIAAIGDSTTRNMLRALIRDRLPVISNQTRVKFKRNAHNLVDGLQESVPYIYQYFPVTLHDARNIAKVACHEVEQNTLMHAIEYISERILKAFGQNETACGHSDCTDKNATGYSDATDNLSIYFIFGGISMTQKHVLDGIQWLFNSTASSCGPAPAVNYTFIFRANGPSSLKTKNSTLNGNVAFSAAIRAAEESYRYSPQHLSEKGFRNTYFWDVADYLFQMWPDGVVQDACLCHWPEDIDLSLSRKFSDLVESLREGSNEITR